APRIAQLAAAILHHWQLTVIVESPIWSAAAVHVLPRGVHLPRIARHELLFDESGGRAGGRQQIVRDCRDLTALLHDESIRQEQQLLWPDWDAPRLDVEFDSWQRTSARVDTGAADQRVRATTALPV